MTHYDSHKLFVGGEGYSVEIICKQNNRWSLLVGGDFVHHITIIYIIHYNTADQTIRKFMDNHGHTSTLRYRTAPSQR